MYKLFFLDFKILISYNTCVFLRSLHSVSEMDVRKSWDWELSLSGQYWSVWKIFVVAWCMVRFQPCLLWCDIYGQVPAMSRQCRENILYTPTQVPAIINDCPGRAGTLFCTFPARFWLTSQPAGQQFFVHARLCPGMFPAISRDP